MMHAGIQDGLKQSPESERRSSARRRLTVPGRVVWRDARGTTRFASIITQDVNDEGVFVECLNGTPIPLYRLAHLQLDLAAAVRHELPVSLRRGKVLTAVYRVAPSEPRTGRPQGYALRVLAHPERRSVGQARYEPSALIASLQTPSDTLPATA
jgi:hypothetical protein